MTGKACAELQGNALRGHITFPEHVQSGPGWTGLGDTRGSVPGHHPAHCEQKGSLRSPPVPTILRFHDLKSHWMISREALRCTAILHLQILNFLICKGNDITAAKDVVLEEKPFLLPAGSVLCCPNPLGDQREPAGHTWAPSHPSHQSWAAPALWGSLSLHQTCILALSGTKSP